MVVTGQCRQAKSLFAGSSSQMPSGSSRVTVRLQPRASRDEVLGWTEIDGLPVLRIRVKAPPVDGAANAALVQLLAKTLGIVKGRVTLVAGATARNKIVEIEGLTNDKLRSLL